MHDGRRAMVRGDFEGAARSFQAAADEHPDDPRAWLALARAEMAAERYPRAREALTRCATLRPHAALPRILIGHTWELQRHYDEALLAYRHAIEAAPRSAYAHRVMGTRLLRWGRAELSIGPLARAVDLDPTHAETWNALALARSAAGDAAGAEEAFRRGIEQRPDHPGLRLGLAALLVNDERYDAALAIYDAIVAERPTFAPAHVGRGILLHELGRPDEAEAAFVQAVRVARRPERFVRRLEAYRALRRGAAPPPGD
ncbi:MAG: tetratricopeptide repeat protein [Sandaracinaceae bacterium]|nr:tetratricopeptide repeat protein [Sandaracinaceae bacterium]